MEHSTATLTDARGHRIPLRPYERVASLVPSLTEAIARLAGVSRLVGRTVYCVEPHQGLATVPTCGGTKNPDLPTLHRQHPDLVLACLEENKIEHLDALELTGVPVFSVMPRNLDDVSDLLRQLGLLLNCSQAAGRAMADLTAARLACGEFRRHLFPDKPLRVAVLIWRKPWMTVGGNTFINAMVQELGMENAYAHRDAYFKVSLEELVAQELDLILLPDEPFKFSHHDAWSLAAAGVVADRRQALLMDGKLFSWYGTRTASSLRTLVRLLGKRLPHSA